jgi:arsenite-transporting ATPase
MVENTILPQLKRINLISGKGGVGRSTLAATLARGSAAQGKKTLLLEIEDDSGWDSALARHFNLKQFPTAEPKEISRNLSVMTLSASVGQEQFLTYFLKISSLTHLILSNQGVKWFLEGAPAFREMGYFYHLLLQLRKNYECIVLDLPATGHLVGLVRLPNILLKMIPFGPIADRLKEGQRYLLDVEKSAAWIVTLPQTLPVSEAIELKSALVNEALPIGGYILNRVPFNPFTREEETVLEAMTLKSGANRMTIDLERIRKLREAERRLSETLPGQVWLSPETLDPKEQENLASRIQKTNVDDSGAKNAE